MSEQWDELEQMDRKARAESWTAPGPANLRLIYFLYLFAPILGLTPIIAMVLAYMNRGKSEAWIETHYTWAIRTFWIGFFGIIVSVALMYVIIGFLLALLLSILIIARCITGLEALGRKAPIRDPRAWK